MKKITIILSLSALLVAAIGCKKDDAVASQRTQSNQNSGNTITTIVNGVQMKTTYHDIEFDNWGDYDNYKYVSIENANITGNVINNGCVMAFFVDSAGRDNPLPYEVFHQLDDGTLYSDAFSYDVSYERNNSNEFSGFVSIILRASDIDAASSLNEYYRMYEKLTFKVCVFDPPAE